MSANQCHRLASETEEERAARLQQMSANQCHRLATEIEEERAARLQRMRDSQASETEEERAARLQQMSANQHHRLAAETGHRVGWYRLSFALWRDQDYSCHRFRSDNNQSKKQQKVFQLRHEACHFCTRYTRYLTR